MDISTFDEYLKKLPIPAEDKRYSSMFFRKREYLDSIAHFVSKNVNNRVNYGYGNCNTKIFIVMDYHDELKDVVKFISPCLEYFNISIQNTWITFKYKGAGEELDMKIYASELKCISPEAVITVHSGDITHSNGLNLYISPEDIKHVLNGAEKGVKDERYVTIMKEVYAYLPKLIPLKEIEYED